MNQLFWFPGYVFLPALVILAIISVCSGRLFVTLIQRPRFFRWTFNVLGAACIVLFLALSVYHLASAGYGEQHSEGFAIKGLLILLGKPLYTDLHDSAERYSLLHGPVASLLFAGSMGLLGRSLFACKLVVFIANLLTGLFTWLAFRRHLPRQAATALTALALCPFVLIHAPAFLTIRPDACVSTVTALALWRVSVGHRREQLFILTVATALAANLKINTVVCLLPIVFLVDRPYWLWELLLAGVAGAVVFVLPFAWPTVSFWNYLSWLRASSALAAGANELPGAIHWFLLLSAPLVVGLGVMLRADSGGRKYLFSTTGLFVGSTLAALFAMTLSATREGASPSYFVPFTPGLFYAYLLLGRDISQEFARSEIKPPAEWLLVFSTATVLTWVITAAVCTSDVFTLWRASSNASQILYTDVDQIAAKLPGVTISMGFAGNQTFFMANHRFRLVAAGQPYFIDATSLMSTDKANIPLPRETNDLIEHKAVRVWLIPRGEEPFSIRNYYPPHNNLFDGLFRVTFHDNYHLIGHSQFYDCYAANE